MPNDLTLIENKWLNPLAARFDAVLGGVMTSKHLIQSVLISFERNPKLFEADERSVIMGAMTFANLRLPVDGATGQAFLLPFKDTRKQMTVVAPCIGYKGYNTIGARGGLTITGGVVREGDLEWDYREGSNGFVRHKKRLDNTGNIIAAWAVAESKSRPPGVAILGIGDLVALMERAPAVRSKAETPYNDLKIGRPAMFEKNAKRRLSRILPFEIDDGRYLKAARVEEAFEEQGRVGFIDERGAVMIEGTVLDRNTTAIIEPSADELLTPRDAEADHLYAVGKKEAEGRVLWPWWDTLTRPQRLKLQPRLAELRALNETGGATDA